MTLLIANKNPLFCFVEQQLAVRYVCIIGRQPSDLNYETLEKFSPDYCIFLHWSHKIPPSIYNRYKCILFHMTDLPYGRGGSPLQNLIVRGATSTKLSAITVVEKLDEGDIYLKRDLDLSGSAESIFIRAGELMFEMINEIISKKIKPIPQSGEAVYFKRRKPEEGNLKELTTPQDIYNYIRMLDAPGYPNAFLETVHFKFEFSKASLEDDNTITAHVRISNK